MSFDLALKKILVTGATGFVGTEIVRQLEALCDQIFELHSVTVSRNHKVIKKARNILSADIADREDVLRFDKTGAVDAVIHAAGLAHQFGATSREKFQKVNVEGTANVLELARRLNASQFILISSVSVYGRVNSNAERAFGNTKEIDETVECSPMDFYGESKLNAENLALEFCRKHRIRLTILRLATVVGEEDKGNFLRLIRQIDRRRFVWIGKGENHKSLIHREDVARACAIVLQKAENDAEIFNVSADPLKISEIVEVISRKLKRKIPKIFLPANFVRWIFRVNSGTLPFKQIGKFERTIEKWLAEDVYSAEKIKRKYGFEPLVSSEAAIEREVEWYLANKC